MKLDVLKNNQQVDQIDFAKEVENLSGQKVSFFIGRSQENHVVLDDMLVSREHAALHFDKGVWEIEKKTDVGDLRVNGEISNRRFLNDADVIMLGDFKLVVSNLEKQNLTSSNNIETKNTELLTETHFIEEDESLNNEQKEENNENYQDSSLDEQINEQEQTASDFIAPSEETQEFENAEDEVPVDDFGFEDDANVDFNDEFGVVGDSGGTQVIRSFVSYELELFGEFAPFDRYLIEKNETLIGRDPEKSDICLNDPEVSSRHAKITRVKSEYHLKDLDSGNGTLLNGERINSKSLNPGDEFVIGGTTFTVRVKSDLLKQQAKRLMPVEENQEIEVEEIVEVDSDFDESELEGEELGDYKAVDEKPQSQSLFSKEALQDPERRKKLLIIAVVILGLFVLFEDDSPSEPESRPEPTQETTDQRQESLQTDDKIVLTAEQKEQAESIYQLARELFDQGRYSETIFELQKLFSITPEYKNAVQIDRLAKEGLARLEEIERERRREIERQERMRKVEELVERARDAVNERRVEAAEAFFVQILELDPQNFEVPQMRIDLEAWQREQDRIAMEKAEKEAERRRQERALNPGRNLHSRQQWYHAIHELESFLEKDRIDDDLLEEAKEMLEESKDNLTRVTQPMLGRARSLREGRDLKGAYEAYRDVLVHYPSHQEAITEMSTIEERLFLRSRKVYREALIAESLSLFEAAKDKFQEVQQISPSNSEYYIKATEKLKEYLD